MTLAALQKVKLGKLTPGLSYAYGRIAHELCDAILLDTGFSLSGAVSGKFFDRLVRTDPTIALRSSDVDLRDASGTRMSVRGSSSATLSSPHHHSSDPQVLDFLVVDGMSFPVVLGNSFLSRGILDPVDEVGCGLFRLPPQFILPFRCYQSKCSSFSLLAAIDAPIVLDPRRSYRIPSRAPSSIDSLMRTGPPFVAESLSPSDSDPTFSVIPSVC